MAARSSSRAFGGGGGSFLGTAAAAAAGVVGGSLLLGSIRSMMGGGGNQQAFGDTGQPWRRSATSRPWSDQSGSDLARDAGINDIGSSGSAAPTTPTMMPVRAPDLFDQASNDDDDDRPRFRRLRRRRRRRRQRLRLSDVDADKTKRPPDRAAVFDSFDASILRAHQITTTLAPTLTRP